MRTFTLLSFSILLFSFSFGQRNSILNKIPVSVFVNGGKTTFDSILFVNASLKKEVLHLYTNKQLFGFNYTEPTSSFSAYWEFYKNNWSFIQFHENNATLLLFHGYKNSADERPFVLIYSTTDKGKILFTSPGSLLAYKKNPFSEELVLYIHEYPCCKSASHSIHIIREVEKKLHTTRRFFVGRDTGDMIGPFFPKETSIKQNESYYKLTDKTPLYWSPKIINENAFSGRSDSNLIIHYTKGAVYKVLYKKENWAFVLFTSGIAHERSKMLSYTNFKHTGVYGWIKQ